LAHSKSNRNTRALFYHQTDDGQFYYFFINQKDAICKETIAVHSVGVRIVYCRNCNKDCYCDWHIFSICTNLVF
jgi:hypothetical protein